mgnify:FL=1
MRDIIISDFSDIQGHSIRNMPMIVIYFSPEDYPGKYVGRVWDIGTKGPAATPYIVIRDNLEEIRALLPTGLCRFGRDKSDVPAIVETWI